MNYSRVTLSVKWLLFRVIYLLSHDLGDTDMEVQTESDTRSFFATAWGSFIINHRMTLTNQRARER